MIIAVRFEDRRRPGDFSAQEYNYKTSLILVPGDMVVCPVAKSETHGVVARVNVPEADVPERFRASLRRVERMYEAPKLETDRRCRICGCTQSNACPGGCSWVEYDLCSACAGEGGGRSDNDNP